MACRKSATRHKVGSPTGRTKRQERSTARHSGSLSVDLVDLGDSIKIALKNDKDEVTRYAVLKVTVANPEAVEEEAGETNLPRVGEIKVIGNTKIPGRLIAEWIPLVPGSILGDADLRRA